MNPCHIDHIVITAPTLEAGSMLVEQSLGVMPQKGGEHPKMGTHNMLLSLGEATYLEVIACNPGAKKPGRPRWFALDELEEDSPPNLRTWVVRTDNIYDTLEACSESTGKIKTMSRGNNSWLITIPQNGSLPINGGAPALIEWQTHTHPASTLKDYGFSLAGLTIHNPEIERITTLLESIKLAANIELIRSPQSKISALIDTPDGIRKLDGQVG